MLTGLSIPLLFTCKIIRFSHLWYSNAEIRVMYSVLLLVWFVITCTMYNVFLLFENVILVLLSQTQPLVTSGTSVG